MATNTAASFTNHTGNGSAGPFNISFSYLSEAEVDVTVGGVLKTITTHYTFTSATQITFTSGNEPANGVAIKFQRDTNISAKKVDFADGSVLTEADLDANSDQVLFAQQEIIDKLGGIEEGATGDQTNAEIRAAVEAATDSNVFTDADHSKLNAIEASATADQTAAEIRTLVESASDSNVFTDADHTKLNGIEASATADQTNAEIRAAVEAASDSNVFTDADHTKLNAIEAGATADQTVSEIKSLIAGSPLDATHLAANSVDSSELVDGSVDTSHLSADCVDATKIADNAIGSEHLQANSVGTSEIADAELTTLAGMQSGTASKLADSTALTADIADLNQIDGMAKQTTITDDDTKFPTSGAVVDFVAAQIAPIGGLEVIANEDSFPTSQPSSGVVISISDIEGLIVNGSGVATNARTTGNGSDNVTINGFPSSLYSKTMAAGLGLMVSSTGSSQTYTYHKLLAKEADVEQLSNDINDFAARYRVGSSNPTTDLDAGDLFFNTSTQKLLVYNSTNSAWEEAQSIGNFFISTFSESVDGSRQDFTVSNAPTNAQQIILSINGVVQKPNSGTSTPSEGFALSGSTVKLAAPPANGSDVFIVVMGSTVNIGTPSNNTVTSAILQNGSVTNAKIGADAVDGSKIADDSINSEHYVDGSIDTAHIADDAVTTAKISAGAVGASEISPNSIGNSNINASAAIARTKLANVDLVDDTSPQLGGDLDSNGHNIKIGDGEELRIGDGNDLIIKHDSANTYISNQTGELVFNGDTIRLRKGDGLEDHLKCFANGAVELYHNGSKKLETNSTGIHIFGNTGHADSAADLYGSDNDLTIKHDGSNSKITHNGTGHFFIETEGSGEDLYLQANDDVRIRTASGENAINCIKDGQVELYHNNVHMLSTANDGIQLQGDTKISRSPNGNGAILAVTNAQYAKALFIGGWDNGTNSAGISRIRNSNDNLHIDSGSAGLVYINAYAGGATFIKDLFPISNDTYDLGSNSYKWDDIYATNGTIQTSDKTKKNTIVDSDLGLSFINKLKPVSYKFNDGTRIHYGLIAQDVETILSDVSKPTTDFAGFIKTDLPDEYYKEAEPNIPEGKKEGDLKSAAHTEYGLRYTEFISPLIKAVQELTAKVETLETKVAALGG